MRDRLISALRDLGDPSPFVHVQSIHGGYSSTAHKLITSKASYFLKYKEDAPVGMFATEARGLELLGRIGKVRVPQVLAVADVEADLPAFMIQEWIETKTPNPHSQFAAQFGNKLAMLHWASTFQGDAIAAYGLDYDTYNGRTRQINSWEKEWSTFFRERRLRPQIEIAKDKGLLPPARQQGLERLLEQLDTLLGRLVRSPSLLHGDLWNGNVLCDEMGKPVLVDPCVYYGDREVDLASSSFFGGFPETFYHAYEQVWPLPDGWRERCGLYNLYHYLRGLNGLGESQGPRVDNIIRRYVG
jgi:fructosamine-3-kinase